MISIILSASDEVMAKAKAAGFKEQKVLIRHNGVESTPENMAILSRELFNLHPFQFLVSDFWGLGPD